MRCGSDCSRYGNIRRLQGVHLYGDIFRSLAQDCLRRAIRHRGRSALLALSVPTVFPYGSWPHGFVSSKVPVTVGKIAGATAVPEGGSDRLQWAPKPPWRYW